MKKKNWIDCKTLGNFLHNFVGPVTSSWISLLNVKALLIGIIFAKFVLHVLENFINHLLANIHYTKHYTKSASDYVAYAFCFV